MGSICKTGTVLWTGYAGFDKLSQQEAPRGCRTCQSVPGYLQEYRDAESHLRQEAER